MSSCHNFDSYEGFMALFVLDKGLDYQGKYVDLRQFLFMLKFTQGSARSGMRVSMGMVTMVYRFTDWKSGQMNSPVVPESGTNW